MNKLLEQVIEEWQEEIPEIEKELETFRSIIRDCKQGKFNSNIHKLANDIIKTLTAEREEIKCRILRLQNILLKRKDHRGTKRAWRDRVSYGD
jgi:uncharacterized protein (UPF0147 family)